MIPLRPQLACMLREGTVIPAHPLALTRERKLDERRQVGLTRYYHAAGAGGVAVGVHSTQFEIRSPRHDLLRPVLELVAQTAEELLEANPRPFIKVAGICGTTAQALQEAELAHELRYDAGLLSLAALQDAPETVLLEHCRRIADVIPVIGFYLQPTVGGRHLAYSFWRQFADIPNVVAVKIAPFNRYQTLDVVRAVADAGRGTEVALYTGNDDNIVADLLTEYVVAPNSEPLLIVGGLLGQWAVWTKRAVELLKQLQAQRACEALDYRMWLRYGTQLTDSNAAIFDAANHFHGCIPGIHEVLRRQGLLAGTWCLNPNEGLSPGQQAELDRVYRSYPHLNDDEFVAEHLHEWLR
jgi:dihydrodipicolinate synthase/N-acetylneuraminate lyase